MSEKGKYESTPGANEAFDALDVADRLIERAYGTDVPIEWAKAIKRVAHARAEISPKDTQP